MKIDFSSICRCCMGENLESELVSIFSADADYKLSACCELQIRREDGLPEHICKTCLKQTEQSFSFRSRCRESELALRRLLADSQPNERISVKLEPQQFMETVEENLGTTFAESPYIMKTERFLQEMFCDDDNSNDKNDSSASETSSSDDEEIRSFKKEKREKRKKMFYVCDICDKTFTDRSTMNRHKYIHLGKNFKCDMCSAAYARPDKLKAHKRKAHEAELLRLERPYECHHCQDRFSEKSEIRAHFNKGLCSGTDGAAKNYYAMRDNHICPTCGLEFSTDKGLKHHTEKNKCGDTTFLCNVCNCVFSTHRALHRHTYIHLGVKYECELCTRSFIRPDLLVGHLRAEHGLEEDRKYQIDPLFDPNESGQYVCRVCSTVAVDRDALKEHFQMHSNLKYKCTMCDKEYHRRYDVGRHMKKSHGVQASVMCEFSVVERNVKIEKADTYECSQCGKTFKQRYKYKEHMVTHSDLRPFLCNLCGSSFKTKTSLQMHEMRHSGNKPHKCEVPNCDKAYYTKKDLAVHTRSHSGIKPYTCQVCGSSYSRSDSLALHFRKHTGFKPHNCEYCGKSFTKREKLKIHTRIHTGEKPYSCSICGRSFTQKYDMIKHERRHQEHPQHQQLHPPPHPSASSSQGHPQPPQTQMEAIIVS